MPRHKFWNELEKLYNVMSANHDTMPLFDIESFRVACESGDLQVIEAIIRTHKAIMHDTLFVHLMRILYKAVKVQGSAA